MKEERIKSLGIDNNDLYKKLSNEYKKHFEYYLLSNVDLSKYDKDICDSKLGFGNVSNEVNLKSNLNEFMNLNHIYVLNEFLIEKLDINQIEVLKNGSDEDKNRLIKETYKEIIKNNYHFDKYDDKIYKINYINSTSDYGFFDNDSLVLAIYYGKNKNKYGSKEKYLDNYIEKKKYLNNISNKIKKDIKEKLNIKCDIIYNKI